MVYIPLMPYTCVDFTRSSELKPLDAPLLTQAMLSSYFSTYLLGVLPYDWFVVRFCYLIS